MEAEDLQLRFLEDISTLCDKYDKNLVDGVEIFQAAYQAHREAHGSYAHVANRDEKMKERLGYTMVEFFTWLYTD